MPQGPYTPPTARVEDQAIDAGPRPRQVIIAVALLWASFILGIPSWYLAAQREPEIMLHPVMIAFSAIVFFFCAAVNVYIYHGRNWARIVLLVLIALSVLLLLMPAEETVPASPAENLLTTIGLVLDVIAVYLLYAQPGGSWFRRSPS